MRQEIQNREIYFHSQIPKITMEELLKYVAYFYNKISSVSGGLAQEKYGGLNLYTEYDFLCNVIYHLGDDLLKMMHLIPLVPIGN